MPEDTHAFHLAVDGLSQEADVVSFDGFEALSQLFEFHVTAGFESPLAFEDVIRKDATLTLRPGYEGERYVHGIVSRVEHEHVDAKVTQYRFTIVPKAWLLLNRVNSRIFQDLTAPAIVQKVLEGAGLASDTDFRLSLQATYTTREYCVQYRESDWDFVCRLLEEEGIYYFFEQAASGHKVVLADTTSAIAAIHGTATLAFKPHASALDSRNTPQVHGFHLSGEIRSGKVTLRDWNFLKPALSLEAFTTGSKDASLEVYDYPGEYDVKGDGDTISKRRLEELGAARTTGSGESVWPELLPGHKFTMSEHPRDSFNAEYLLTRVEHWGMDVRMGGADEAQKVYRNSFELMPADVLFRPPRVTRRPQIHGVQTAIVVGPSGEEIYVDEHGRVKVQFHWDRLGKTDDKSSCWIRVAQTWASSAYGAIFIPRIKDEVVVTFLEGDPDRPLIVGSVYHGTNVPPYPLPDHKTRSTIKSNSSPGGGGSNELRFEDKKGSEEVYLHGQKDWTILIENDKNQKVGHDETLEIDNDRTKTVKHDQVATIDHDDTLTVKHDQTMTVKHDQSLTVQNDRTVTVTNDHSETVSGKQTIAVTKAQSITISDKQEIAVSKTRSLTVDDDVTETFKAKLTVSVTGDVFETLKAKRTVNVTGDHTESIGGKEAISVTGDSTETVSGKKTFTVTGDVTITSGSSTVTVKPSGEITIQGVKMTIDASGPLKVHGATVDITSDGPATFKGAMMNVKSDGVSTVKGAMVVLDGQTVNVG